MVRFFKVIRSRRKPNTYLLGIKAERWAKWYLRFRGYHILAERWRCRYGELDLVAHHSKWFVTSPTLVFIEVKARRHAVENWLSNQQIYRWQDAAKYYLCIHQKYALHRIRFDVMLLTPCCHGFAVRWDQNVLVTSK